MLGTRLVYLLLAFLLSFAVSEPIGLVAGVFASSLPDAVGAWVMLAGLLLSSAGQFFAAGVLFAVLSGLSWKRAAVWAVLGTAALNLLCDGRQALSAVYFAAQFGSLLGAARALAAAAAGAYGCWWLEQRELNPWVDQARAVILSMIGQ